MMRLARCRATARVSAGANGSAALCTKAALSLIEALTAPHHPRSLAREPESAVLLPRLLALTPF